MPSSNQLLLFSCLIDGRAYTLNELCKKTGKDKPQLKFQLDELVDKGDITARLNRQRLYYFLPAQLIPGILKGYSLSQPPEKQHSGINYCRHCYKHLAGYIGVRVEQTLVKKGFLIPRKLTAVNYSGYDVSEKGWRWFKHLGIDKNKLLKSGGRLTKQCLDFSERKNHLGGRLGDALLKQMLQHQWLRQVPDSREIILTQFGKETLQKELGLQIDK